MALSSDTADFQSPVISHKYLLQKTVGWYQHQGRERQMGLGSLSAVSLAQARQKAAECRSQRAAGVDPIQARDAARTTAQAATTFRQCAESYIKAHSAGWRNARHTAQWSQTLETYVYPTFGDLPVSSVDTGLVLKVLEPIWTARTETASRVRGRIELILDWAKVSGYRQGENPARWRGHLAHSLPLRSKVKRVKHHTALPYADLPGFMKALRLRTGVAAHALEFLILTAARTDEVIKARWSEIDIGAKLWIVPAERMKGGREHRVPLCNRALAIMKSLQREHDFIFPGQRLGRTLYRGTVASLLERMKGDAATVHGFRSTFRDWAAERTNFPSEVVEMALAHAVGDKVEAAYRRGDLFEKRRQLMAEWADYCASVTKASQVVRERSAAAS